MTTLGIDKRNETHCWRKSPPKVAKPRWVFSCAGCDMPRRVGRALALRSVKGCRGWDSGRGSRTFDTSPRDSDKGGQSCDTSGVSGCFHCNRLAETPRAFLSTRDGGEAPRQMVAHVPWATEDCCIRMQGAASRRFSSLAKG